MKYLLDTNICIFIIKKKPAALLEKISKHSIFDIGISSITVAELWYGVEKSQHAQKNRDALLEFLSPLTVLPFDEQASIEYGRIRNVLEQKGMVIGGMDLLIAAHAVSQKLTVITNNVKEFCRIKHLPIEDWTN